MDIIEQRRLARVQLLDLASKCREGSPQRRAASIAGHLAAVTDEPQVLPIPLQLPDLWNILREVRQ